MEHSKIFDKAKYYYDKGLWSEARLQMLVNKGQLTPEEYDEIVNG